MNHNPNNFKVGDVVMLDEQWEVMINKFTPQFLFATVSYTMDKVGIDSWEVMTNRLTPVK